MTTHYDSLFSDFDSMSSAAWKQQLQYELKGSDYNQTLVWESPEGIKVKPFYHADENIPRHAIAAPQDFLICQDIFVYDLDKSVYRAKDSLKRGAECLRFKIPNAEVDVSALLMPLDREGLVIYLKTNFFDAAFFDKLRALPLQARVFVSIDPLQHLAREGNWIPGPDNFKALEQAAQNQRASFLSVDATLYAEAGATTVQQLAYALAQLNEYFERCPSLDGTALIETAIGPNYFFEIAKLRALRLLVNTLAKEQGKQISTHILATPQKRNKTLYDYNVNMLRTTTECMSAVLGGADAVANLPYDAIYHKSNEFGERIARNQLLVLKHESYFAAVSNAAEGSYYIESLTRQIAQKSLELFKEIEAGGGFLAQLKDGTIQRKIRESAQKEQDAFQSGQTVLIGTNKYPNPSDRMSEELELFPFVKNQPRKTLITPVIPKRLAEKLEQERLESEKSSS